MGERGARIGLRLLEGLGWRRGEQGIEGVGGPEGVIQGGGEMLDGHYRIIK